MTKQEFIQKYGKEFANKLVEIVSNNDVVKTGKCDHPVKPAKMYLQLYREISKFITNDCKATKQLFDNIHNYFNTNKDIVAHLPNTGQVFRCYMSISKEHSHLLNLQKWDETISTKGISGLGICLRKNYEPSVTQKRRRKNTEENDGENHKRPKHGDPRFFHRPQTLEQIWEEMCNKKTLIITGAGVSVAAGISPFTGEGGLYEGENGELVKKAWTANEKGIPDLKLFYETNKSLYLNSYEYTDIHNVINWLEERKEAKLITMNVDDLHELAWSEPIHIHGAIWKDYQCQSTNCKKTTTFLDVIEQLENGKKIPTCQCGASLIPPVVFYGTNPKTEDLKVMTKLLNEHEHIIVIGSSLTVNPVAQLVADATDSGKILTIVNRDTTPLDHLATHRTHDIAEFAKYMNTQLEREEDEEVTSNPKKFKPS